MTTFASLSWSFRETVWLNTLLQWDGSYGYQPFKNVLKNHGEFLSVLKTAGETFNAKNATRVSSFEQKFSSFRMLLWILMALQKLKAVESLNLSLQGSSVTVAEMLDALQTTKVTLLSLHSTFNQNSHQDQGAYRSFWAVWIGFTTKKCTETQTFGYPHLILNTTLYQNIGFSQVGISRDDRRMCHHVWIHFASIDLKIISQFS